jgi:hypothetical protein
VADLLSKEIDYEDYAVTPEFFGQICEEFGVQPVIDCFANKENTKTKSYFSLYYAENCCGIDCFNYNWKMYGLCWLFPPPKLVGKTVNFMQKCKATGLLLIPQWKNAYFYPLMQNLEKRFVLKRIVFNGTNAFSEGSDVNSYFGPNYKGNVEVYLLKFV